MRKIIAEIGKPITLGRIGENETTIIVFNLSRVAIPNATYSLIHKRHGDETSYPCETYIENGNLCWKVKSSDVAVVGMGECEVLAIVDEKVAKDEIYTTRVLKALDDNIGEVPPPYQPWVDSVLSEFAFSHKLENITCHYVSIPHSAEPHCDSEETETGLILTFYIPMGADGKDGKDGKDGRDGKDGFTPLASVTKTGSTSTITITDKVGTTSVEVKDGKDATQTIEVTHEDDDVKLYTKEEVDALLPKAMRHIGTYTIDTNTSRFNINTDSNGREFDLERMSIVVHHPITSLTDAKNGYIFFNNNPTAIFGAMAFKSSANEKYQFIDVHATKGQIITVDFITDALEPSVAYSRGIVKSMGNNGVFISDGIRAIHLLANGSLEVGTTIDVYGY